MDSDAEQGQGNRVQSACGLGKSDTECGKGEMPRDKTDAECSAKDRQCDKRNAERGGGDTERSGDTERGSDGDESYLGEQAPLIEPEQLRAWVLVNDADVLVVNKPGWVVCHPSKNGPWSSLVGACRELTGIETLHLIARLDRETSGLVILGKHRAAARRLQMAIERRAVGKEYLAILHGELKEPVRVKQPLAKDLESAISSKVAVRRSNSAKSATSHFMPLGSAGGYTLARVTLETGRKHQIRAHALWLGHPIAGDKVYGADETLFLEFIEKGWTERMEAALPLRRQALHCWQMNFTDIEGVPSYLAPLPQDMRDLLQGCGLAPILEQHGI